MAKLLLRKIGGGITDTLTALPKDVVADKVFIGADGDKALEGSIPKRGSPNHTLPINGRLVLLDGHYDGGGIGQKISVVEGQTIGPGARDIVINCAGKYMTGNIVVLPVKNLSTSVVKKHEFVGGVGPGTWEGYVNIDPAYLYYMGAAKEGYKATKLVKWNTWSGRYLDGIFALERSQISIQLPQPAKEGNLYRYWYQNMIVFEGLIDFTSLRKIEIQALINHIPNLGKGIQIYAYVYTGLTTGSFIIYNNGFFDPNPAIGNSLAPKNPHADDTATGGTKYYDKIVPKTFLLFSQDYNQENTYYCDVSGISGKGYLYLGFNNSLSPYGDVNINLKTVKMI